MDRSRILPLAVIFAAMVVCLQLSGRAAAETPSQFGDANCDSAVNSIDAMLVLKSAASLPVPELTCPKNGDVDFHSGLTSEDALLILQYHAALLVALPPDALQSLPASTCLPDPPITDGFIMATDALKEADDSIAISRRDRDALAVEIDGVLGQIRAIRPEFVDIGARSHTSSLVSVNLEPDLMDRVVALWNEGEGSGPFITGSPDFDLINAVLGLCDVYPLRSIDWVFLYLDSTVDDMSAATLYESAPGVLDAHGGNLKTDNPVVEAVKDGDTWYVIFRDAWGDCLSGCIYEELFFYTVTDGSITEVDRSDAFANPGFQQLIERLPGRPRKP